MLARRPARQSAPLTMGPHVKSGSWRSRATALVQRRLERRWWVVLSGTWPSPWRRRMRLTVCSACFGELLCSLRCASQTTPGGRSPHVAMASPAAAFDRCPYVPETRCFRKCGYVPVSQQVRIVVGLEDQQVDVAELAGYVVGHPAEVGGDHGAAGPGLEAEAERLTAVVRARRTGCTSIWPTGYVLPDSSGLPSDSSSSLSAAEGAARGEDRNLMGL